MSIVGILVGILILSSMMIVHELGHFISGRKLGFKIEAFSLFMGPVLFEKEKDGIKYNIKLFPIGASVSFAGEYEEDENKQTYDPKDPGLFTNRPKWARAIVLLMGPLVNLVTAVIAFFLLFSFFGYTGTTLVAPEKKSMAAIAGLNEGDKILRINNSRIHNSLDALGNTMLSGEESQIVVEAELPSGEIKTFTLQGERYQEYRIGVQLNSEGLIAKVDPASNGGKPGLLPGDKILTINGLDYQNPEAQTTMKLDAVQKLELGIEREGQLQNMTLETTKYETVRPLGFDFAKETSIVGAISQSFQYPYSIIKLTGKSIGSLVKGRIDFKKSMTGPVGVVGIISDVVQSKEVPLAAKISQLLWLFALISTSLGFMNLLPIPPLDGHHLFIIGIEGITRRTIPLKVKNAIAIFGFVLIIGFSVLILYLDVSKFFT